MAYCFWDNPLEFGASAALRVHLIGQTSQEPLVGELPNSCSVLRLHHIDRSIFRRFTMGTRYFG
ncbi:MAG TPA: hypothetical protein VLX91_14660 [Candidatus Acidoferrales bacterium]|nr:hypothetical protein [Candidatus Acidoferrales bacterium]